jgi:hypothetical protein
MHSNEFDGRSFTGDSVGVGGRDESQKKKSVSNAV